MKKIQILVGGVDFAPYVDVESLSVDNNIIMTSDTASCTIQLDGEVGRPRAGQEFIWRTIETTTGAEVSRDFGGVVVSVQEDVDGISLIYTLTIKSYEHWFNRHLVSAWYNQDYAENTIRNVVNQFCPGFTTNNVQNSNIQIIPQYFAYQKPSECIKLIADQLQYGMYIDYYKDLHFYPSESAVSPLPGNLLDVDNDLSSYGDLSLVENGDQVYNKIYLKGFKTRSNNYYNLTFPGDGQTLQWSLGYRASSLKGDVQIAVFPSLAAYQSDITFQTTGTATNGTQLTIKKDIIEGAPDQAQASGTAYIHYTQHLIRIPSALGGGALPAGYVVAVHFYYLKDQVYMGQDITAQSQIKAIEGTDGCYEYAQEDKSLTNSTIGAAKAKAELLLMKYGLPQIQGSFTTFTPGWRAGQFFNIATIKRMGGISGAMYVLRVSKKLVSSVNGEFVVQSTVQFADSPYLV